MRLALMIEGQEGVTWDDWSGLAETCERSGVEALFRSDHYISWTDDRRPGLDAWATICGLAARTTTLELGTLVSPGTFRHPSVLVRNAATADEISGGRITLGLGAGWNEREHDAYGIEFTTAKERVARFAEQLEIVHDLLRRERVDFDGSYYRLHDAPGLDRPKLRLLVGGGAKPGTVGPAVRFADEYNTFYVTVDEARERKRKLDDACTRAGRDPATLRYSLMAPCVIGEDEEALQESARRVAHWNRDDAKSVLSDNASVGIVGTLERAAERLRDYEAVGVDRVMLQHFAHDDLHTVELIGRELAPLVR